MGVYSAMTYFTWWQAGLGLAGAVFLHWLLLRRLMAVSGRFTELVNRVRRRGEPSDEAMSAEELAEAMRAATIEEFGAAALPAAAQVEEKALAFPTSRMPVWSHPIFFGGLALGGAASALVTGSLDPVFDLRSEAFHRALGGTPLAMVAVLFIGGIFVGAGTRMAGGCTTGHGLCGTSRLQLGSLVSTAAFFGAGALVSLLLEWLR